MTPLLIKNLDPLLQTHHSNLSSMKHTVSSPIPISDLSNKTLNAMDLNPNTYILGTENTMSSNVISE